jgi:uncharacterized LabA/DUF88 family protein
MSTSIFDLRDLAQFYATSHRESTYEIVSIVAYLIGVPKPIFENVHEPPQMEYYQRLEYNKNARIIRNLCRIRTSIELNYKRINEGMRMEYRSILSMPEYVPQECLNQLSADGISFVKKSSTKLFQHIIEINRLISDRINNCKNLFPTWINWEYVKELFVMPDGLTEQGTKVAAEQYYSKKNCYPYQVYLNWFPEERGNILYNDRKFVNLLYEWHNDYFEDEDKVSDVGDRVKGNIYDFLDDSQKAVVLVDCENSDPYRLNAVLNNLDAEELQKISSIILFDDVHTSVAWRTFEKYTTVPVEHLLVQRLKEDKSLVDPTLMGRTFQEFYRNEVDSFVLVSSDSDYWALIRSLPEAHFLVMIETEKCGPDMKRALETADIFYCYIDDFYSGNSEEIKRNALIMEMNSYLEQESKFNVNEMMDKALRATRVSMTKAERKQFFDRYVRQMELVMEDNGDVVIRLKYKNR